MGRAAAVRLAGKAEIRDLSGLPADEGRFSFLKRVRSARENAANETILCEVLKPLKAAQN